ncbi:MAG: ATP-dependent helicase [Candidatus Symbiothrix sp.]|jgi:SNF2 family DNA or RNA helicase|nr:ATP-dependent helicase [Candidatus Symbiothrix sp.]
MDKLVLIVTEHRRFGWKINLYSAVEQSSESIRILGLPNIDEEIEKGASKAEVDLWKAVSDISEEALLKAYVRDKDKSKILQSTIDNLIRPKIEKQCSKILDLARQTDIPFYLRETPSSRAVYIHDKLELLPEKSRCLFNFIKDENGLRYFISLTNKDEEILLQEKPAIVLSNEPCIVLLGSKIHRVEDIDSKKLIPFFDKTHINVPLSSEKLYIEKFILKTIPKYDVRIEGIEMTQKNPGKKAVLTLEEDFQSRLTLILFFHYGNRRFTLTTNPRKRRVLNLEEIDGQENICWFDRDLGWENRLYNHLLELNLEVQNENGFYLKQNPEILQKYGIIDWINQNSDKLSDFEIEQKTEQRYYQGKIRLESKVSEKIDWFEIEIEVVFDRFKIPFSQFKKHILTGSIEYVLPDGSIFILPEEWFHRYQELFLHTESSGRKIRARKIHTQFLADSINGFFIEDSKKTLEMFNQIPLERPAIPQHLDKILRPYQKEGYYWLEHLRKLHFGGCLADDMGLGKTIQTITLLESVYSQELPASLVVAPKSLLHNWHNELRKFAPDLKIYIHAGTHRNKPEQIEELFNPCQVIITSYGMVRADVDYLSKYAFHYLILDESQYIKNPGSAIYQAIRKLYSTHKLTLTGTPIENSLTDLWAQFNFINQGLLGSLSAFRNNYINKIHKEKNKKTHEILQRLIHPFLLRRTKEEVTPELPPLSQEIVYCDMTEEQEKVYVAEKNSIRNKLLENHELFVKNNFIALQSLIRLRLLSNHPAMIYPQYCGDSGKFDQILLYFEDIKANGHKVLIFSSFVKSLEIVAGYFDEKGWKYAMLTGKTEKREKEIDYFNQDKDVNAFLISLKAGGTGLNLTEADYVFIIDPWWNPAAEMQALSRAHRIGQNKKVMVYRFISSHSIEEKIISLQEEKNRLSETFITSNNPLDNLSSSEIEDLFV